MQYEFLKLFPKRMKSVGRYFMLIQNSIQKTTWKQYGFLKADEQMNLIFAVLLYIMEQSLREEHCTMDDIGAFIDGVNQSCFEKSLSYEDCRELGDFIVNVVLSNEGKAMYFDGFDFEQRAYQIMHISYVANRIVYTEGELRRTSYYLTDDGYNLLLGTLEIENNMKLTIHEMIFKMHLEKQSYDKAVDEIKNIFNLMRIQLQKIQEAMGKIRRNALNYSVADYRVLLEENLETISDAKQKFEGYRELVKARARELEEENINVKRLDGVEEEKLESLHIIEGYLNRTIDEHQKILNSHFDLKTLYTRELEALSQMSLIRRFSLRAELFEKILEKPDALSQLDVFLRPLLCQELPKEYNLNKALELQRPIRKRQMEEEEELLDFDEHSFQKEQELRQRQKLLKYAGSLGYILDAAMATGEITLKQLRERALQEEKAVGVLIPNVEIFKEIMVELIKNREISVPDLRRERSEYIKEGTGSFALNEMLLELLDGKPEGERVVRVEVHRLGTEPVEFLQVQDEAGRERRVRCSDVLIRVEKENGHGI